MIKAGYKILSILVLLAYMAGLSNYVIVNLSHYIHHQISHTFEHHHDHAHSSYKEHGHSHNSFIDYSLFIEDTKSAGENNNDASATNIKIYYFNHLSSSDIRESAPENNSKRKYQITKLKPEKIAIKPPYIPPEFS